MLTRNTPYRELGADYFQRRDRHHLIRAPVRKLENLGFRVQLPAMDLNPGSIFGRVVEFARPGEHIDKLPTTGLVEAADYAMLT